MDHILGGNLMEVDSLLSLVNGKETKKVIKTDLAKDLYTLLEILACGTSSKIYMLINSRR